MHDVCHKGELTASLSGHLAEIGGLVFHRRWYRTRNMNEEMRRGRMRKLRSEMKKENLPERVRLTAERIQNKSE